VSASPWDSLNLGDHVQDNRLHVAQNRQILCDGMRAVGAREVRTVFMQQVHGCDVLDLDSAAARDGAAFDACVSTRPNWACTVMVADCLPVLFAHRSGQVVAAAHAGWRGLLGTGPGVGVLEATWHAYAAKLGQEPTALLAAQTQVWLGPCIGPQAFEVGEQVREAFVQASPKAVECFAASSSKPDKWHANLPALARQRLQRLGIVAIYGNDASQPWCSYTNKDQYFSHRRDSVILGTTGRMAACIWRT